VIQNAPVDAAQDEVIFSAKYPIGIVSGVLIMWCLVFYLWRGISYVIAHEIYDGIVVGREGPLHFMLLGSLIPTLYR
jgi:hypothetical protein